MIHNAIAESSPTNSKLLYVDAITHIVLHWTSLSRYEPIHNEHPISDDELTGAKLVQAFCRGGMAPVTGGAAPYHFLVLANAEVDQIIPLSLRGAHVPGYNYRSIGIAYVGEGRLPTLKQFSEIVALVADLWAWIGPDVVVAGHTALVPKPDGSPCPHPDLSIKVITDLAHEQLVPGYEIRGRLARDTIIESLGYQIGGTRDTEFLQNEVVQNAERAKTTIPDH